MIARRVLLGLLLLLVPAVGCSQLNLDTADDWDRIGPTIERYSELAAIGAFNHPEVAPHKPDICAAVFKVSTVLSGIENSDATFEQAKFLAMEAVNQMELGENVKRIAVLITGQVLDISFAYASDVYKDFLEKDETRIVLVVSKSVSMGLEHACTGAGPQLGP